jgi:CRP-like cAMP-binding protein
MSGRFLAFVRNADDFHALPRGSVVFRAGDQGHAMYAVRAGTISISLEGTEVERLGEGGVFGEMALVGQGVRSATATVIEDAELVAIGQDRFDA